MLTTSVLPQVPLPTVPDTRPTSLILNQFSEAEFALVHEPPQDAMYAVAGPSLCVHCDQTAVIAVPAATVADSWFALALPLSLQLMVASVAEVIGLYELYGRSMDV